MVPRFAPECHTPRREGKQRITFRTCGFSVDPFYVLKGEVFAYVGRTHNLKDVNSSASCCHVLPELTTLLGDLTPVLSSNLKEHRDSSLPLCSRRGTPSLIEPFQRRPESLRRVLFSGGFRSCLSCRVPNRSTADRCLTKSEKMIQRLAP